MRHARPALVLGGVLALLAPACLTPLSPPDRVRRIAAAARLQEEVSEQMLSATQAESGAGEGELESEILEKRRGGLNDGLVEEKAPWKGTRLYWDQGPRLDTLDGELAIVFGGRLQLDGATFREDDEIDTTFGSPDEGWEVRRAFAELGAVYRNRYEFRLMVDFADTFDFRDFFVGVFRVPILGGIRAGYFKEPFGLEEIESSNHITFLERSLPDVFVERRNLGVMTYQISESRRRTTWLGVFQDTDNELDTADGYGVTGRITGLPVYRDSGRRLVHLGAAATYRTPPDDQLRWRSRPESDQAQVLVDTGYFPAERDFRGVLELASVHGSLSLQGEGIVAVASGDDTEGTPVFPSFYAMLSWIATGEQRLYRRNVGAFGFVHPESSWGAWELIGRYSYLDLDSENIQGGVLHDFTAGLNVYVTDYTRVMFNYILAHPEGFDYEHIFQMRLQLNI